MADRYRILYGVCSEDDTSLYVDRPWPYTDGDELVVFKAVGPACDADGTPVKPEEVYVPLTRDEVAELCSMLRSELWRTKYGE